VITLGGIEVGGKNPCRFVAEISNNHNGSLVHAFKLIDAAKEAGADFCKWQAYTVDELVSLRGDGAAPEPWGSQGWAMRKLYEKAATPLSWFPLLFQRCRDVGLVPFASVFGLQSLLTMETVGCEFYKIARMESENYGLTTAVRSRRKPMVISINGERECWRKFDRHSAEVYLYCPPKYPTPNAEVSLPYFDGINGSYLGLSSHNLDARLPIAAVARGAKLLEYHFQLDDEKSELESEVSLTATEFQRMVTLVKGTEEMLRPETF
jgi:sialic acid synthase SpsE